MVSKCTACRNLTPKKKYRSLQLGRQNSVENINDFSNCVTLPGFAGYRSAKKNPEETSSSTLVKT